MLSPLVNVMHIQVATENPCSTADAGPKILKSWIFVRWFSKKVVPSTNPTWHMEVLNDSSGKININGGCSIAMSDSRRVSQNSTVDHNREKKMLFHILCRQNYTFLGVNPAKFGQTPVILLVIHSISFNDVPLVSPLFRHYVGLYHPLFNSYEKKTKWLVHLTAKKTRPPHIFHCDPTLWLTPSREQGHAKIRFVHLQGSSSYPKQHQNAVSSYPLVLLLRVSGVVNPLRGDFFCGITYCFWETSNQGS